MMQIIGWFAIALLGVVLLWNGAFMLISPRAWFRLPAYLRLNGGLTEKRFGSGWGAIEVRIAGAVFVGGILWAIYDILRWRN